MERHLQKLQDRADSLIVDVYRLLEEIQVARLQYAENGSFPLDSVFSRVAKIEAQSGFISMIADDMDDMLDGEEQKVLP